MKLLESKKLKLPKVFFITDREEIKELPIGIPYIFGDKKIENQLIRLLEYETLYQAALKSGFPFDFKKILEDNGYKDTTTYWYSKPLKVEISGDANHLDNVSYTLSDFVKDNAAYVNIEKLKELKVFPLWLDKIEEAISTNIHNFAVFNSNMYNKKLEGMYGGMELKSPSRNLIIIDISGSIPKAVSSTTLTLAKQLSESFYADLLITGSKSTLYKYEELYLLNIETIYKENGMDNDQTYFKNLLSSEEKEYKTVIAFGDNHSPGQKWSNSYNKHTQNITKKEGQALCKWKVDKIISFHTNNSKELVGYAEWFTPKKIEHIENWIKYLN